LNSRRHRDSIIAVMKHLLALPIAVLLLAFNAFAQPAPQAALVDSRYQIPPSNEGQPGAGPIRRADWFQKIWTERRSEWATRVAQDQHALVFLGDSITQGWGDSMGGSFPGAKVANRGISGDTTRGVLIRLREDVLSLHPAGIVLLIGTNDLEDQAEPETIVGNLKLILGELKKSDPEMPIVLCDVFPSSASKKRPADKIKRVNELYAEAVKGDRQVTMVDTWSLFADAKGDAPAKLFPDLLHPNAAGYVKWAAALRPVLATLGFVETGPDVFTPEPGFVSLFNGHDLTGWGFRPTSAADIESAKNWQASDPHAAAWPIVKLAINFDGKTASNDDRYLAKAGRLIVATAPEGRRIQQLSTTRNFPRDFILRLEFRATPNADSGIFIREPQLQCRDYLVAGPYNKLAKYRPQDWNEIEIVVHGRTARCTCNGEVLEETFPVPATGPIGLEGDRGQMEYRRIRIKELP
jgi:lysophospholipase L1-like esterase